MFVWIIRLLVVGLFVLAVAVRGAGGAVAATRLALFLADDGVCYDSDYYAGAGYYQYDFDRSHNIILWLLPSCYALR